MSTQATPHPLFHALESIILASGSPRRQDFLAGLGLEFEVIVPEVDEAPLPGEGPCEFAIRMASVKAETVGSRHPEAWVIGADTVVSVDQAILGKPADDLDALRMLELLRGRRHQVITGYCLHCRMRRISIAQAEISTVRFHDFPREVLAAYVATGEPADKAGAYGIQGIGGFLVREIEGSCDNVIGLPVGELVRLLLELKVVEVAGE